MNTDALALLFRRLVLAAREADALSRPIEVAEILDKLVPYRAARRDGLLDTNDDYLHAVMQLLAGERSYMFADDLMQDDLRNELSALNPDLGALAQYRTAKVRISTTQAEAVLAGDTSIDLRPPTPLSTEVVRPATPVATKTVRAATPVTTKAVRPTTPVATAVVRPPATPTSPRGVSVPDAGIVEQPVIPAARVATPALREPEAPLAPAVAAPAESEHSVCPYCSRGLPTDRTLKYCPHCGINLRIRRCPGCSAEMEAEWKFCVTCGRSAP